MQFGGGEVKKDDWNAALTHAASPECAAISEEAIVATTAAGEPAGNDSSRPACRRWLISHEMACNLDRDTILNALARLSELLGERGVQGEICLMGGTVMVVAYKARPRTKDVDAIFEPAGLIRELARTVGAELDLPEGWINDAAKGFVSSTHETIAGDLPQFENLRLVAPVPEYILAMKCMASRIPADLSETGDVADIRYLIRRLGLSKAEEAIAIVARYYPEERIPARARFLLEDVFGELEGDR